MADNQLNAMCWMVRSQVEESFVVAVVVVVQPLQPAPPTDQHCSLGEIHALPVLRSIDRCIRTGRHSLARHETKIKARKIALLELCKINDEQ